MTEHGQRSGGFDPEEIEQGHSGMAMPFLTIAYACFVSSSKVLRLVANFLLL
jgi:hypothetical protein